MEVGTKVRIKLEILEEMLESDVAPREVLEGVHTVDESGIVSVDGETRMLVDIGIHGLFMFEDFLEIVEE